MLAEEIERAIENRNRFRDPPFETGWWLPVVFALVLLWPVLHQPLSHELLWFAALIVTWLLSIIWLVVSVLPLCTRAACGERRQWPLLKRQPDDTGKGDGLLCAKLGRLVYYTDGRADGSAMAFIALRHPVRGKDHEGLLWTARTPDEARQLCEEHARSLAPYWRDPT